MIHTDPGFFVLHHKACCWPALLSTLLTREPRGKSSWQTQGVQETGPQRLHSGVNILLCLALEEDYLCICIVENILLSDVFNFGKY